MIDASSKPSTAGLGANVIISRILENKSSTILVVDDDCMMCEWLADVLGEAGYSVRVVSDGKAVAREIRSTPIDLLITDIVMPEQEGIETINEVRREFPQVKIVAMSGANSSYLKIATALGASASVLKPFTADEIVLTVRNLIG